MKKTFRMILSLLLVTCMMVALTVCVFATETEKPTKVSFKGLRDIVFVYGGKEMSMAEELKTIKLSQANMNKIWESFLDAAERDEITYTTETKDRNFVITIGDDTFLSLFQLKNIRGYNGYVSVQVMAAAEEEEIDTVMMYLWRGALNAETAEDIDFSTSDLVIEVALDDLDAAIVKLTRSSIYFFNDKEGFSFAAVLTTEDGTQIISMGEFIIHDGTSQTEEPAEEVEEEPAEEAEEEAKEEPEEETKEEPAEEAEEEAEEEPAEEIIPWKNFENLVDHPSKNDDKVSVNAYGYTVEIGDRGWGIKEESSADHISIDIGDEHYTIVSPIQEETPAD